MSLPANYSLTMISPPATLDEVHTLLAGIWEKSPEVSAENQMRFETALIELVSNIFRYADKGEGVACSLKINISNTDIEAVMRDTGEEGNIEIAGTAMPDPLEEGGRGIPLINALVDEFTYENDGEHNIWRIARKLESPEES